MKMIMPIKATESGKITHAMSPGTVISAGDLLASLELKDASKVKKILNFEGALDVTAVDIETDSKDAANNILAGYKGDAEAAAQAALADASDLACASAAVVDAFNEYLRVETIFDGKLKDDVVRQLAKDNSASLETVVDINRAHGLNLLCQFETFSDLFGESTLPDDLPAALDQLSNLSGREHGDREANDDASSSWTSDMSYAVSLQWKIIAVVALGLLGGLFVVARGVLKGASASRDRPEGLFGALSTSLPKKKRRKKKVQLPRLQMAIFLALLVGASFQVEADSAESKDRGEGSTVHVSMEINAKGMCSMLPWYLTL